MSSDTLHGLERPPIHHPRVLLAVLVVGAAGLGLFAVGITGSAGWVLIAPGFVAMIASLVIAGWLQAPQIRANAHRDATAENETA